MKLVDLFSLDLNICTNLTLKHILADGSFRLNKEIPFLFMEICEHNAVELKLYQP